MREIGWVLCRSLDVNILKVFEGTAGLSTSTSGTLFREGPHRPLGVYVDLPSGQHRGWLSVDFTV